MAQAFVLFPVETVALGFLLWSAYCSHIHCRAECQSVSGCTQHRPAMMRMQEDGDWLLNCCLCIHHSPKWRIRAKCCLLGFCLEVKMFTLTGFKEQKSLHVGIVLQHICHICSHFISECPSSILSQSSSCLSVSGSCGWAAIIVSGLLQFGKAVQMLRVLFNASDLRCSKISVSHEQMPHNGTASQAASAALHSPLAAVRGKEVQIILFQ